MKNMKDKKVVWMSVIMNIVRKVMVE